MYCNYGCKYKQKGKQCRVHDLLDKEARIIAGERHKWCAYDDLQVNTNPHASEESFDECQHILLYAFYLKYYIVVDAVEAAFQEACGTGDDEGQRRVSQGCHVPGFCGRGSH